MNNTPAMKQYEREFFVSRVRSGVYPIKVNGFRFTVLSPTIDDEYKINAAYKEVYETAQEDGFKTQDEMLDWMRQRDIWTEKDDQKEGDFKKNLEILKIECFKNRNNEQIKNQAKRMLRVTEKAIEELLEKKYFYQDNTCEGIAAIEKSSQFIRRCTYLNNAPYDFAAVEVGELLNPYFSMILSDGQVREIVRGEPWRTLWALNDSRVFDLFRLGGREMSIDQRNVIIWSKMYDNIYESVDCPANDVIEDDDMLDGWFILQKQKRDKERAESEIESTLSPKIKNAGEIFVMANSKKDAERIDSMNSTHSKIVKQQRFNTARERNVEVGGFQDEKLDIVKQSHEQFKEKFRS